MLAFVDIPSKSIRSGHIELANTEAHFFVDAIQ